MFPAIIRMMVYREIKWQPSISYVFTPQSLIFLLTCLKDSTLIETASGKKFASDPTDWKWWHPSVPTVLKKLYLEDGYAANLPLMRIMLTSNIDFMS